MGNTKSTPLPKDYLDQLFNELQEKAFSYGLDEDQIKLKKNNFRYQEANHPTISIFSKMDSFKNNPIIKICGGYGEDYDYYGDGDDHGGFILVYPYFIKKIDSKQLIDFIESNRDNRHPWFMNDYFNLVSAGIESQERLDTFFGPQPADSILKKYHEIVKVITKKQDLEMVTIKLADSDRKSGIV